ncbi:MAG TPA: TonB-dependent receptor [Gemmatimonadales bacterium]|nr:TonB-dependent receptor [Gemmatimonadales bacterium]
MTFWPRLALASLLLVPILSRPATAQIPFGPPPPDTASTDSSATATTSRRIPGAVVEWLPVDSAEGALLLEPGVGATAGGLSLRGGAPGRYRTYVNGVDLTPGHGTRRLGLAPGTVGAASAIVGPLPASLAGSPSGALLYATPAAFPLGRAGRLSWETDRFTSGLGVNRIEGMIGRSTRSSTMFLGGQLVGQKAAEFGADARDAPIFDAAGSDTVVTVPGVGNVDVPAAALARGDCALFAGSANARVADNYGAACDDDRTPAAAASGYRLMAVSDNALGRTGRISVMALRARDSERLFDYASLFNPGNLFGRETEAQVYAVTLTGQLGARRRGGTWRLAVSRQTDRLTISPLTPESEADTRDPAGGFMLGGLDFRWDRKSFPVDSALVADYRANNPGTRRSPYDLDNVDQYRLVDAWRDGPYALFGFSERGGPVGRLSIFEEKRTVAAGSATWRSSSNSDFTLGAEYVRYAVASYEHELLSQAFSDVYRAEPRRGAVFAEQRFRYGELSLVLGIRHDFYDANGARPWVLDTLPTLPGGGANPRFGEYHPFPRISSYSDADGSYLLNGQVVPLVVSREDERHSAWSPTLRTTFALGDASRVRAGITRTAAMPDLSLALERINTDLAITSPADTFGTDLDLERAWHAELGVTRRLGGGLSADVAAYRRTESGAPAVRLVSLPDPTRGNALVDLLQRQSVGTAGVTGLETRLGWSSPAVRAAIGWTWQRARIGVEDSLAPGIEDIPAPWERPHTLVASLGFDAPDGQSGIFRDASLALALRWSSGTPYSACADDALSDHPCLAGIIGDPASRRLPALRQLDLRFARRLGGESGRVTAWIDARNLFGRRNAVRVYSASGGTTSESAEADARQDARFSYQSEAAANDMLVGGTIDLTFGGAGAGGCAGWVSVSGSPAEPNCVSLVRAEARWGNGDGLFTESEQAAAADAAFAGFVGSGFFSAPRRIRLGFEIGL